MDATACERTFHSWLTVKLLRQVVYSVQYKVAILCVFELVPAVHCSQVVVDVGTVPVV